MCGGEDDSVAAWCVLSAGGGEFRRLDYLWKVGRIDSPPTLRTTGIRQ